MLRHRQPRRSEGFTLMELMIVVAVISILAAAAGPSIAAGVQEGRAMRASSDMIRLITRARSASQAYGRAYLARYATFGNGRIQVYRGTNNRCNATDWNTIMAGPCAGNPLCIDDVDMRRYARGSQTVRMRAPGYSPLDLCFEPSGRTFYRRLSTERFTDRNISASKNIHGGIRFSFQRRIGSVDTGVKRWVVLPLGGDPRVLR